MSDQKNITNIFKNYIFFINSPWLYQDQDLNLNLPCKHECFSIKLSRSFKAGKLMKKTVFSDKSCQIQY